jgi:ribosomal protein L23
MVEGMQDSGGDLDDVRESTEGAMDCDVLGEKVINDGLLCSILHAMSGAPNADEMISRIERDCTDVSEILVARKKLFTYYTGVICSERNKLVLDIDRHTTKNYIKDIVDQLVKVDKVTEVKMFCMPFDYERRKFETENSRLTRVIEGEISNEFDMKIEALENRMNEKNRALHDSIVESVNRALQQKTSYSDVALGARPREVVHTALGGNNGAQQGAMGPPVHLTVGVSDVGAQQSSGQQAGAQGG